MAKLAKRVITAALRAHRHLRSPRVLCDDAGQPLTQKIVQGFVRRAARRAQVNGGVHVLRHTFCSYLAMRGAPARAIQEAAGHQDLTTTQRDDAPAARATGCSRGLHEMWRGDTLPAALSSSAPPG
jgi:site-specific recombinase XerD